MIEIQNSKFKIQKFKSRFKTFNFLLAILTFNLLLFTSPTYAAGASLSISPATGTFNKGCDFTLEVKLDTGGIETDGTDAIIFYDPTRLNAKAIRSGTIYADYPGNSIDAQNGRITISGLASVSSAFVGQGTLALIEFSVLPNAPEGVTQVTFDFDPNDKAKTTDSNVVERGAVVDILNEVTNGNFTIGTGSCASTTPTPILGGRGSTETVPTKTLPKELPQSADFQTTLVLATGGMLFLILGVLGLARSKSPTRG